MQLFVQPAVQLAVLFAFPLVEHLVAALGFRARRTADWTDSTAAMPAVKLATQGRTPAGSAAHA